MEHPWWLKPAYILLAWFGGGIGYVMRQLEAKENVSWWRALAEASASAFAGILVLLLCLAMKLSVEWTGIIVGVCGWLGANATIRLLEKVTIKKIGADNDDR